ncbi:MAG: molybdate ABC transporter substrate-binding protein [Thalassotalea sp.]|nr:molybdate ABC transporter substrate-binding protein [Thalassotalea sp.]
MKKTSFPTLIALICSVSFSFLLSFSAAATLMEKKTKPENEVEVKLEKVTLKVAVASNFLATAKALTPAFEEQYKVSVQWINGASGSIYQQIKHGAPYDAFFSADKLRPEKLKVSKHLLVNSVKPYTLGQLSLFSAKHPNMTLADIKNHPRSFPRVAIANPETAPYGLAAKVWLSEHGLWEAYEKTLIVGSNVGQTFQQVRTKAVDAGFVSSGQLVAHQLVTVPVPLKNPEQLLQYAGVLATSKNAETAELLIEYFRTESVQLKLSELGYLPLSMFQLAKNEVLENKLLTMEQK